jgi:hypothetical protein
VSETGGLGYLLEAAKLAAAGKRGEAEAACRHFAEALNRSLLHLDTVEQGGIAEAYLDMARRGLGLVVEGLTLSGVGREVARALADALCGIAIRGDGCVMAEVLEEVSLGGKRLSRGSVTCVEPLRAAYLEAAGLLRLVRRSLGAQDAAEGGDADS